MSIRAHPFRQWGAHDNYPGCCSPDVISYGIRETPQDEPLMVHDKTFPNNIPVTAQTMCSLTESRP
jgi:hypothetical protein